MRNDINLALKEAIKTQQKKKVSTLRLVNAAIKDRDIAARSNGSEGVSDSEILEILAKMIKQRRESATTYAEAGREELAKGEQEEIEIISDFLPKQLDDNEVQKAVNDIIAKISAEGLRDMGRVMSTLKEEYAGQMDFSKASSIVKQVLAN